MNEVLNSSVIPQNDAKRVEALHRYQILDTPPEEAFNHIARIMAEVFEVPIALISLVDKDRVFLKGNVGMPGVKNTDRSVSLCAFAILSAAPTVFENTLKEPCLLANPLVHGEMGLRFYAAAPLTTFDGFNIGAVCIVDKKDRSFSQKQQQMLVRFSRLSMHEIELRQVAHKQVAAEQQLQAANKELQFVTDTMPQMVWATEANGYAYFFNQQWLQYTGLGLDDIKGNGWAQLLHPDDLDPTLEAWYGAVKTGGAYDVAYRVRRHDGAYRWFLVRGTPMKDEQGKIVKWYGTTTDIHDQKMAEEAQMQSKERFDLVAKATQDAIWDWNLLTAEMWWNEGFKELFGYNDEDIEPTIESWYSRVHPDDKDRVTGSIHQAIDHGGKNWAAAYRFQRKDGSYATVYDRGYALYNKEGKPYRMLSSMQDVTERKQTEEDLERKVCERTTALENLNKELIRSNANLAEFAYAASHDLKEPVRKIHFFSDRIKDRVADKLDEEDLRLFDRMQRATKRMGNLIDDLLLYSHISRGAYENEEVDLNEKVYKVLEDLELEVEEKGANITVDPLPAVNGHKRQLQQLFQNLISNALKYSHPGLAPRVQIKAELITGKDAAPITRSEECDKPFYKIVVKDNGIGFEQKDAERIFNVFTRLHGTTEFKGTGVGLSIVRKVAENHDGYIWAESEPGKGAVFTLLLPAK